MQPDTEKIIRGMIAWLSAFPLEEYLSSESFLRFCGEHDLGDTWREYLEVSEDRPDLYGNAVKEHALGKFLVHIFHERAEEFPVLLARLLISFSQEISLEIPQAGLKEDLQRLGYSRKEMDHAIAYFKAEVKKRRSSPGPGHCRIR
jgi:hypothetical protein